MYWYRHFIKYQNYRSKCETQLKEAEDDGVIYLARHRSYYRYMCPERFPAN